MEYSNKKLKKVDATVFKALANFPDGDDYAYFFLIHGENITRTSVKGNNDKIIKSFLNVIMKNEELHFVFMEIFANFIALQSDEVKNKIKDIIAKI